MKIRTVKYIVKEGIFNAYKNKLMSLASVSIVMISVIIFGIFLLFVMNMNHNTKILKDQPELQAFCEYELDDTQVGQVEQQIQQMQEISEYRMVTRQEAFERFKESLGEDASVLEGYDESLLPVSFVIKLKDAENSLSIVEQLKKIPGVRKVSYSKELNDFISKFTSWINLISSFLIIVLLVFSVFIIANTIKLTVFARRREISIMKYIGSTDWFIRWPFVVEGVIIGLVGATIAFLLTGFGYSTIESRFNNDLSNITINFFRIISFGEVRALIILSYALLGSVVGAIGSVISIRKYLRV